MGAKFVTSRKPEICSSTTGLLRANVNGTMYNIGTAAIAQGYYRSLISFPRGRRKLLDSANNVIALSLGNRRESASSANISSFCSSDLPALPARATLVSFIQVAMGNQRIDEREIDKEPVERKHLHSVKLAAPFPWQLIRALTRGSFISSVTFLTFSPNFPRFSQDRKREGESKGTRILCNEFIKAR